MNYFETPINYLINSIFNPFVRFYDEKDNRFFVGESSLFDSAESVPGVTKLPLLEKYCDLIDTIFINHLTIEEYCFMEENFDERESICEFAERTHLKQKYLDAKNEAIPLIFETWSRENYLDIDWELATFA